MEDINEVPEIQEGFPDDQGEAFLDDSFNMALEYSRLIQNN